MIPNIQHFQTFYDITLQTVYVYSIDIPTAKFVVERADSNHKIRIAMPHLGGLKLCDIRYVWFGDC